jgi:hypothetical protein
LNAYAQVSRMAVSRAYVWVLNTYAWVLNEYSGVEYVHTGVEGGGVVGMREWASIGWESENRP